MSDRNPHNSATPMHLRCRSCDRTFLHQHHCPVTGAKWRRRGLTVVAEEVILMPDCLPPWPVFELVNRGTDAGYAWPPDRDPMNLVDWGRAND